MIRRVLIVSFLFAALFFAFLSLPPANSQSSSSTTTVTLAPPASGGCTILSVGFSAVKGQEVSGTVGSNTPVNFYILNQTQLNSFQNCHLPDVVRPFYIVENSVGYLNPYSSHPPFPTSGTYYFVFLYLGTVSGSSTVQFTYPNSITMLGSQAGPSATAVAASSTPAATVTSSSPTPSSISTSSSTPTSSMTSTVIVPPQTVASASSSVASQAAATGGIDFGTIGAIAVVIVVAIVGGFLFMSKRKKGPAATAATVTVEKPKPAPLKTEAVAEAAKPPAVEGLSTGYGDLDHLLVSGLPKGYAVLVLSPPCDERELLLGKIVGSALATGMPTFYLSNDPSRVQAMVNTHWKDFYALSPAADKIMSPPANLYKMPGIENLSDLNIATTKTIESRVKGGKSKLMIIDFLTDILLHHKAVTSRKWLSDFIAKRKAEDFTILAFLNPLVSSKEETQTLIDVFDGVIEIYERELKERARRFLVIKRMYGQRYSESELMLDKDKLF